MSVHRHDPIVMEQLPDEVLLEVLQYVDVRDLLACRRVCKRLGALALDGRVWRHRKLYVGVRYESSSSHRDPGPLHLLRLAPCLDHLHIRAGWSILRVLTTTTCAIASLTLEDNFVSFSAFTGVVSRQKELGRLRRVHLIFVYRWCPSNSELLEVLTTSLPRLETLTSSTRMSFPTAPPVPTALVPHSTAYLKKFSWTLFKNSEHIVRAVLAGHSSTLEEVELAVEIICADDAVALLLAALPKLHSLSLSHCNLPGLPALAACATLQKLRLQWPVEDSTDVQLLLRAKQLRDVRLTLGCVTPQCYRVHDYSEVTLGCELLEALASPALERLELNMTQRTADVSLLLRALPSMPALRHLVLNNEHLFCEVLQGVTLAAAPALRILELNTVVRHPCPHKWAHSDPVSTALIANPSLHIQIGFWCALKCNVLECKWCAMDCHKHIWKAGLGKFSKLKLSIHLQELQLVISS